MSETGGNMPTEMKTWCCPSGHVLGQVLRNGSGVRQLLVYRQAIDRGALGEAPEVMAVAEGLVLDVRCSVCGSLRTWVPGQEALERLIRQVQTLRAGEGARP